MASGDARDDSVSDPKKIIMKLRVSWGRASANQLMRVLKYPESGNSHSVNFVGEGPEHCAVCKAFEKAPHVPIAGTSTVSMFNEKVQVDLAFLEDLIALHAMDMLSEYSLPLLVQWKNPQVRDVFCGS